MTKLTFFFKGPCLNLKAKHWLILIKVKQKDKLDLLNSLFHLMKLCISPNNSYAQVFSTKMPKTDRTNQPTTFYFSRLPFNQLYATIEKKTFKKPLII